MTQPTQSPVPSVTPSSHSGLENLDCYRLAVELAAVAPSLLPRGHASLKDQIQRASASALLNLAEGWGRWQVREKAHHYAIARGSLLESAAAIDLIRARGLANEAECERARALCSRVGRMLDGLIRGVGRRAEGRR
jgi:four helix bundle protein